LPQALAALYAGDGDGLLTHQEVVTSKSGRKERVAGDLVQATGLRADRKAHAVAAFGL
jgi:hypothetical protein